MVDSHKWIDEVLEQRLSVSDKVTFLHGVFLGLQVANTLCKNSVSDDKSVLFSNILLENAQKVWERLDLEIASFEDYFDKTVESSYEDKAETGH